MGSFSARQNLIPDSARADFCEVYRMLGNDPGAVMRLSPGSRRMVVGGGSDGCAPGSVRSGITRRWRPDSIRMENEQECQVRATVLHPGGSNSEVYTLRREPGGRWYLSSVNISDFVYN